MADIKNVIEALQCRAYDNDFPCSVCAYYKRDDEHAIPYCDFRGLLDDVLELMKEQQEEHKRMISWLSKFCRHIDNGDKWLTDEENLEFFREKMKQQFGWFAD